MAEANERSRGWVRVLAWVVGAVIAVGILTFVGAIVMMAIAFSPNPTGTLYSARPDSGGAAEIQAQVVAAHGSRLETVSVYPVLVEAESPGEMYFLTFRLRGAPVAVASLIDDPATGEAADLLPTASDRKTPLTDAQTLRLMSAWAKQTDRPIELVCSYGLIASDAGVVETGTVDFEGKPYDVRELWAIREGRMVPPGGKVRWVEPGGRAYRVFRLPPDEREAVFLGTTKDAAAD